jgi:hypothetical protein
MQGTLVGEKVSCEQRGLSVIALGSDLHFHVFHRVFGLEMEA